MKKIKLTKGLYAKVDDTDYEVLSKYKWCADSKGYSLRSEKISETGRSFRKQIFMHRAIMNPPDGLFVDHINGDVLDNQRSNLRLATASQNMRNRKISYRTRSGFKGVWFNPKKSSFVAYIKHSNRTLVIKNCRTAEEAAIAYNKKAKELFGEFARLNEVSSG